MSSINTKKKSIFLTAILLIMISGTEYSINRLYIGNIE